MKSFDKSRSGSRALQMRQNLKRLKDEKAERNSRGTVVLSEAQQEVKQWPLNCSRRMTPLTAEAFGLVADAPKKLKEAYLTASDFRRFKQAGLTDFEIKQIKQAAVTDTDLIRFKQAGLTDDDLTKIKNARERIKNAGLTEADLRKFKNAGLTEADLRKFKNAGLTEADLRKFKNAGLTEVDLRKFKISENPANNDDSNGICCCCWILLVILLLCGLAYLMWPQVLVKPSFTESPARPVSHSTKEPGSTKEPQAKSSSGIKKFVYLTAATLLGGALLYYFYPFWVKPPKTVKPEELPHESYEGERCLNDPRFPEKCCPVCGVKDCHTHKDYVDGWQISSEGTYSFLGNNPAPGGLHRVYRGKPDYESYPYMVKGSGGYYDTHPNKAPQWWKDLKPWKQHTASIEKVSDYQYRLAKWPERLS